MMATERIRSLCYAMTNEMQIVIGASELEDLDSSLRAIGRAYSVLFTLQKELELQRQSRRVIVWPKGAQKC